MNVLKNRALTLLAAVAVAGTGCKGDAGSAGTAGQNGTTTVTTLSTTTSGLVVAVKGVTVNADQTVAVNFTVKDGQGNPVDLAGKYSTNAVMTPRFSLSQLNVAADGTMLPYTVLTKNGTVTYTTTPPDPSTVSPLNPTALSPADYPEPKVVGSLVENGSGAGDYTYTFPAGGSFTGPGSGRYLGKNVVTVSTPATVDPKSTNAYAIWIEAARQTNLTNTDDAKGFKAVNVEYDFVPANPSAAIVKRQVAATADCTNCHRGFRPEGSVKAAFHGGLRVEAAYCDVCHNPARTSTATVSDGTTPAAFSAIFVHRIHASKELLLKITDGSTQTTGFQGSTACTKTAPCTCTVATPCTPNSFHGISDVTYPQDLRNCDACHKDAAQGAQAKTTANRAVCGSCHDYVVFDPTQVAGLPACVDSNTLAQAKDANGNWLRCAHSAGANTDDTSCKGCHVQGGSGYNDVLGAVHVAIAPPDPNSTLAGGKNANTNASYVAAAGALPAGANKFTYDVKSVSLSSGNPVMVFRLLKDGNAAPFDNCPEAAATPAAGTGEIYNNFVGSPSLYFVWAQPQDNIAQPADFNVSASAYLKTVCLSGKSASSNGLPVTIAGPDSSGYYTATLTGVVVPGTATMLTGGVGYTYSLSGTPPLVQTNLPAFPYSSTTKIGGLSVPAPDVWKIGTGFTGRRAIVETARCDTCHAQLGVNPTFHAGQRNDGPTCSWCHTPNRTSSGWAANAKDFIHAIHAGDFRMVAFNWHAAAPGANYGDVTFPGPRNDCQACHLPGTYDFSASASAAALSNLLVSTTATGRFDSRATTNPSGYFSISPYVTSDNSVDYGYGYATSNVKATLPDGISGSQGSATCSPSTPCICSTTNPCSVTISAPYTVNNVPVTFTQTVSGVTTTCANGGTCTCTTAQPCAGVVATCSLGTSCDAQATTLVTSPITAACVACHDSPAAKGHMVGNGGLFYAPRSELAAQQQQFIGESCLVCHGAGNIAAIADVHR